MERRFAEQQMFYCVLWLIRSYQSYKNRVQSSHPRGGIFYERNTKWPPWPYWANLKKYFCQQIWACRMSKWRYFHQEQHHKHYNLFLLWYKKLYVKFKKAALIIIHIQQIWKNNFVNKYGHVVGQNEGIFIKNNTINIITCFNWHIRNYMWKLLP